MDDHRAGPRGGWANEQGCKVLLDPGEGTPVCLLRSRVIVEDADRRYSVVGCINHIVSHEAFNITDDRNRALLNSARELFGHASLGFTLTNGGVHGTLLHRRGCPRSRLRRSSITPRRGEQQDSPRIEYYAIQPNRTILDDHPAPRKPMPVMMPCAIRVGSVRMASCSTNDIHWF